MALRERVWEDLAADLEYHPKRGWLYLGLAAAAFASWISSQPDERLLARPLVLLLGGVALLLKGVFLLRKSSEGLGLTQQGLGLAQKDVGPLPAPARRKDLPPVPILAARIIQDFGTGPLVLSAVLHAVRSVNESLALPSLQVFLSGAVLVALGWLIRRFAGEASSH